VVAPWRALEVLIDDMVDDQWGEPVELHPMAGADVDSEASPDPTRKILKTVGVLMMPGAAATGEAGTVGTGLTVKQVQNDVWVSLSERNLKGTLSTWKEEDRAYFPDRDIWYKVLYPIPSATGRPQIYLARLQVEQN
jgi:hypothetical protein